VKTKKQEHSQAAKQRGSGRSKGKTKRVRVGGKKCRAPKIRTDTGEMGKGNPQDSCAKSDAAGGFRAKEGTEFRHPFERKKSPARRGKKR